MTVTKKLVIPALALIAVLVALVLFFNKALSEGTARPQEPSHPLPYHVENVTFDNGDDHITLAGTLTMPAKAGVYPAVVLISGSGPQNRDEELAGHRPFLVLADHLTRKGIAVLRYDDRGVGKSTGYFRISKLDDFASDVKSAIAYLRTRPEIDTAKLGLIGHSEGGIVAPMVAASSDDVNFIVMLAGPGIKPIELLPLQQYMIAKSNGVTEADAEYIRKGSAEVLQMLIASDDREMFQAKLTQFADANWDRIVKLPGSPKDLTKEHYVSTMTNAMTVPWYRDIVLHDPASVLEKLACPVLALNGEKDVQVPPKENLAGISAALSRGGNNDFIVKELQDLNHLFQECETGSLQEYAKIEQTFSPVALNEISEWILSGVK